MDDDMATMPIRDLIDGLREKAQGLPFDQMHLTIVLNVLARRLEEQADMVDNLISPGWDQFVETLKEFLSHYPADIFTGESGDPGALFIVALRKAYEDLSAAEG